MRLIPSPVIDQDSSRGINRVNEAVWAVLPVSECIHERACNQLFSIVILNGPLDILDPVAIAAFQTAVTLGEQLPARSGNGIIISVNNASAYLQRRVVLKRHLFLIADRGGVLYAVGIVHLTGHGDRQVPAVKVHTVRA